MAHFKTGDGRFTCSSEQSYFRFQINLQTHNWFALTDESSPRFVQTYFHQTWFSFSSAATIYLIRARLMWLWSYHTQKERCCSQLFNLSIQLKLATATWTQSVTSNLTLFPVMLVCSDWFYGPELLWSTSKIIHRIQTCTVWRLACLCVAGAGV